MKGTQQLYRVKLNNPQNIGAPQQIDGYLGNNFNDGKVCEYTRGQAIKKATMFGGKIEKVPLKVVSRKSFKLWISIEEHTEFTDGTDDYNDIDPEDLDNIAGIGKFETVEAAKEFMQNLYNIYGE